MKILVTGAAGFIGFHVCKQLLSEGHSVVGLDNLNDYYEVGLKYARLQELGVQDAGRLPYNQQAKSSTEKDFSFIKLQLEDRDLLPLLFKKESFEVVCNLAAQAGVRYSIDNPEAYVDSNIVGFLNILEGCRQYGVRHLVYASSSSVYGLNEKVPFHTGQSVDRPISLYAASKKTNELMAHTYSHLYGFCTTGLRFFTVYGPWGRPDMALFLFTKAMIENKPIQVFNHGNMSRDFTYIDDICKGVTTIINTPTIKRATQKEMYKLYNIGNSSPVALNEFIAAIETALDTKAIKEFMPMQAGDIASTWADVSGLKNDYQYQPDTPVKKGIENFINWYKKYYKIP
jgi:UDP-glucuronate 4-epimerase